ncbi:hypothetical protein [Deinococcus budaensis]|uniref:Uncharacterized protein n=1 Tax=Deinococcus budaensis TaxID=1665626 RepID=A0A7W8LNJ0_9DEIO|nr:hypothetical protein [Deinococcus budaensis]MBB5232669.1 hypothetical protein [Deinococcus budaensis]
MRTVFSRRLAPPVTAAASQETLRLSVVPERVLRAFLWLIAGLIVVPTLLNLLLAASPTLADQGLFTKLYNLTYLDREQNLPSYVSTAALFVCAGLMFVIAQVSRRRQQRENAYWWVLGLVFLGLSFDETAGVHEGLSESASSAADSAGLSSLASLGWVTLGLLFVGLFAVVFLRFWLRLAPRVRLLLGLAAALYLGGALGMEVLGSRLSDLYGFDDLHYKLAATVEETLEFLGTAVLLYALLCYLRLMVGRLDLHFR